MFLPCGLSQGEIDAHLRDAARSHFEGGAMTVHVIACCTARPEASLPLPVAPLTFAPHGEWDGTDRIYDLDEYTAVINHHGPFEIYLK